LGIFALNAGQYGGRYKQMVNMVDTVLGLPPRLVA